VVARTRSNSGRSINTASRSSTTSNTLLAGPIVLYFSHESMESIEALMKRYLKLKHQTRHSLMSSCIHRLAAQSASYLRRLPNSKPKEEMSIETSFDSFSCYTSVPEFICDVTSFPLTPVSDALAPIALKITTRLFRITSSNNCRHLYTHGRFPTPSFHLSGYPGAQIPLLITSALPPLSRPSRRMIIFRIWYLVY
jgi:hypothetical protein